MHIFRKNSMCLLVAALINQLILLLTSVHSEHLSQNCSDGPGYTLGSTFERNLRTLLSSLSTNCNPSGGFSTDSTGENPNRVHGLVLCRGDANPSICQDCLDSATDEIFEVCPNSKEAIIWYQKCMIHYSDHEFFGKVDVSTKVLMWNVPNISVMDDGWVNGKPLMYGLVDKAPAKPSMFAAESASFGPRYKRYGLVQCTRDLSREDCKECLKELMKDYERCCVGKKEWQILAASCTIRYDAYGFYEEGLRNENASQGGRMKLLRVVIIACISSFIGLVIMGFCICYWRHRRRLQTQEREKKSEGRKESMSDDLGMETTRNVSLANMHKGKQEKTQDLPLIDFCTLQSATNNFSTDNKLGEGGFGPVYKGILPDGNEIAVKRLSRSSVQGMEEFKNEIRLIANLQHRNLVRLLYCCIEREEKLLVYEFMPNTSLDVFLFDKTRRAQLDWSRRQNIIVGIARGLLYLHEDSRLRIIHRDLKASNILLDNEMNPKISDFGLARIFGGNQSETNTNRVVGTYGYMAPEYAMEGLFSVKSDVFSFGVLLLEILSGKRNKRFEVMGNALSLLAYTWQLWNEDRGLEVIDPLLVDSCSNSEALRWIHIGLLCVQEDAADRPTMSSLLVMLGSESVNLPQPTQPAFSVGRGVTSSGQTSSSAITCSVNEITVSILDPR